MLLLGTKQTICKPKFVTTQQNIGHPQGLGQLYRVLMPTVGYDAHNDFRIFKILLIAHLTHPTLSNYLNFYQGLTIGTPVNAKSASFRVTIVIPCTNPVAAIRASLSERGSGTWSFAQHWVTTLSTLHGKFALTSKSS
jgi:hypothetical protein